MTRRFLFAFPSLAVLELFQNAICEHHSKAEQSNHDQQNNHGNLQFRAPLRILWIPV